ncbi:MAG: ABC transporter ATP-binding protein [Bacilli bacterium]|nr:ABC transporter ATP-binding protein [Bacilli bacterium]MDD4733324.1 ABC transporter ATP-binding protein [Bacilli bacterium]
MIKKIAGSVRKYRKETILAPLIVAIEVVFEVSIPFLMAKLIDLGVDKGNINVISKIGLLLIILALASLFLGILAGRLSAIASAGFAKNLRHDIYYKIQDFSFANIDKFSTSSLITRMTTDVNNAQHAFQMILRIAVRAPLMMTFSLIMAFSINYKVSLIFLAATPLLSLALLYIIKKAMPLFEQVFKTYDKLNNAVLENVRGIRDVKSYVQEEAEIKKFEDTSEDIYKKFTKAEKIVAINSPLMQFFVYLCIILISFIGARLIISGNMKTGELMSLITYSIQILMSLMMISMFFVMITISMPSLRRIFEVLDTEVDLNNPVNPIYIVKDGSIKFDNVSFSYVKNKEKLSLKNINLEIKSGEVIGIIGGTGSSKTTLVQLIPRLYDTTIGKVYVGGKDVKEYDIKTLRDEVSFVLQKNVLFSGTIKENLRWGNENASEKEMKDVCSLAQADEFIEQLSDKYDSYIEQGGANLSGGQRQRLCIARALLKNPKILILDDSTSAVDTKTDALIRKSLKQNFPNITKIIIAQRIASVEDADKIIILDDGEINGIGTHKELLKNNNIYKEVYQSQKKGVGKNE